MAIFKIHHITRYQYDSPVVDSVNEIKVFPYSCAEQEVLQMDLNISFSPDVQLFEDYWGNRCGIFSLLIPHDTLSIESRSIIRTTQSSQLKIDFHSDVARLDAGKDNNQRFIELSYVEPRQNQERI